MQKFFLIMRNQFKLTIDVKETYIQLSDVSILGIVTNYSDFTFVANVNRTTKFKFARNYNFLLWKKNKKSNDKFIAYFYNYAIKYCKIIIVNTKNENNDIFISNWDHFNFIIIVEGRDHKDVAENLLSKIKGIITYGEILKLKEKQIEEQIEEVVQLDIFGNPQNVTKNKPVKHGIGAETLDNLLIAIDDFLGNAENFEKEEKEKIKNRKKNERKITD